MATYDIAHIREQGIDLIIVLVDPAFGFESPGEQQQIVAVLQECATQAGLAGTVIPVWDAGAGRIGFLAPQNWLSFFSSIDLTFVIRNINRKLVCE
jgi:hypothetical protein